MELQASTQNSIKKILQPHNKKHSIKEVVISIFLADQINLTEFKNLNLPNFSDSLPKMEALKKVKTSEKDLKTSVENSVNSKVEIIGRRFVAKQNGKVTKLFQAVNETNRTFISYHDLDYGRWNPFLSEYTEYIKIIADYWDNTKVKAFSLQYVDEFTWIKDGKVDYSAIFDPQSKYLPDAFFDSLSVSFNLLTEKIYATNIYYDRIDINIGSNSKKIVVTHNITRLLNEDTLLKSLISQRDFIEILNWSHKQNKDILTNIFNEQVSKLIGLIAS